MALVQDYKFCGGCKTEKLVSEFYKDRITKDGLTTQCKLCRNARTKQWQMNNKDRAAELARQTYQKYSKQYAAKKKQFRVENLEGWAFYNRFSNDRQHRRRARLASAFVEVIDRQKIFERDKGICYLCLQSVDPLNWDLEHKIPLSKGGSHCYDNVAVSHHLCNQSKGSKVLSITCT